MTDSSKGMQLEVPLGRSFFFFFFSCNIKNQHHHHCQALNNDVLLDIWDFSYRRSPHFQPFYAMRYSGSWCCGVGRSQVGDDCHRVTEACGVWCSV